MRKLLLAAVAMAAVLLGVAPMTAASAATHDVLTTGKVGGTNVKAGAILTANGSGIKFATGGSSGIKCKQAKFTAKVTKNPKAKGTATESLTHQTFSKCSVHGISGATGVKSITLNHRPYKTTIKDSGGDPVTVYGTNTTLKISTSLGSINCVYKAKTTTGHASNSSQTITFSKQKFKFVSGPKPECPASGTFSATFGPVLDKSVHGSPHVFVN
jgi:hypothetical protein